MKLEDVEIKPVKLKDLAAAAVKTFRSEAEAAITELIGSRQKVADEAERRANDAQQTANALEQRIALARTELATLEKKLKDKQAAFKQLYGEGA